jgi:UDP:flavonoid glycosyltransferase YjiC (YdhE family)
MPLSGHLNPMTALARRLRSPGNEIVFFGVPDVEPFARAADLDFVPYGERDYPVGSIDKVRKYSGISYRAAQWAATIAEDGIGASAASIAKAAAVAEGSLFPVLPDKDKLLNELYRELKLDMRSAMLAGFPLTVCDKKTARLFTLSRRLSNELPSLGRQRKRS